MRSARQLELAFDDTPRWEAPQLESPRALLTGRPLRLVLTENRSVLLSVRRQPGQLLLRLHRMFLHAPECVVGALARNIRRRGRAADGEVRRFMNANLYRVSRTRREMPPLCTRGRAFDLAAVYADINAR